MDKGSEHVLALVMMPPPIHGASVISQKMLSCLKNSGVDSRVVNTMPSRFARVFDGLAWKLLRSILVGKTFFDLLAMRSYRPKAVYIGISGGAGLFFDCIFALAINRFGVPVYVHHHNFSYIQQPSRLFIKLCQLLNRGVVTHIVLCSEMGERLIGAYPDVIDKDQIFVLSNAAFFVGVEHREFSSVTSDRLVLGYLANITVEKGILDLISAYEACVRSGLPVLMRVAGPCQDEAIRDRLVKLSELRDDFEYLGAVYDQDKLNFFESIDLLVFPTRYANEAEPLVIYEAAEHGVPSYANARGCISSMVERCGGWVSESEDRFVDGLVEVVASLVQSDVLSNRRRIAIEGSEFLRGESQSALRTLVDRIGCLHN